MSTDKVPLARSASTTAYAATMAEFASFTSAAYVPNYYTGSPSMDGAASAGAAAFVSRGDHRHPTDTSLLSLGGGTLTGFLTLNANPTSNLHAATKQYVDGSAPVGGPYLSVAAMHDVGRNLTHNATMTISQRGAGPWTANGNHTLDRWVLSLSLDTASVTQAAHSDASRAQVGDEAAAFVLANTFTGNAGAAAYNRIMQKIENVRRLAGTAATVSFWAASGAGTPKLGVGIVQNFGTGGSPSAAVVVAGQSVTINTTYTRYSLTFTIPSTSGKTLGTANDSNTELSFWFSSGTTQAATAGNPGVQSGTVALWGVQLEIGSVATPLEKRDPVLELQQCQRFYQTGGIYSQGYAAASVAIQITIPLMATMRATATITPTFTTQTNCGSSTSAAASPSTIVANTTVTATGQYVLNGTFTASADL